MAAAAGCSSAAQEPDAKTVDQAMITEGQGMFPGSNIRVCWVQQQDDTQANKLYFNDALESQNMDALATEMTAFFAARTRVNLQYWGPCTHDEAVNPGPYNLRIFRNAEFKGSKGFLKLNLQRGRGNLPDGSNVAPPDWAWLEYRHEFTHGLGFDHDQNRTDSSCSSGILRVAGETEIGPPDDASIMSYCGSEVNLTPYDILAYRMVYGSPGRFVSRENGLTYRLTNGINGPICQVQDSTQLQAFGAISAYQPSALLQGSNLVVVGGPFDIWSLAQPLCSWPDGFVQSETVGVARPTYLALGGDDAVDGVWPTICVLAPEQLDVYNAKAATVYAAPSDNIFLGRTNIGQCPWPHSYYATSAGATSTTYRWDGSTLCQASYPMLQGFGNPVPRIIAATASLWSTPSSGPCPWPDHLYQSTFTGAVGSGSAYGVAAVQGGRYCWFVDAANQTDWLNTNWAFPKDVISLNQPFFSGDTPMPGSPLYGKTNNGACGWSKGSTPDLNPDYAITIPFDTVNMPAGRSTAFGVGVEGAANVSVSLSITGVPAGVSATFAPANISVSPSSSSMLSLAIPLDAPPQSTTMMIRGSAAGELPHSLLVPITITTCEPNTCVNEGISCGASTDQCGHPLNCGTCPAGINCVRGHCACRVGWSFDPEEGVCVKNEPPPSCGRRFCP